MECYYYDRHQYDLNQARSENQPNPMLIYIYVYRAQGEFEGCHLAFLHLHLDGLNRCLAGLAI